MLRVRTIWLSRGEGWFWKKYPRSILVEKKHARDHCQKKTFTEIQRREPKERNVIWRKGLMCAYFPQKNFLVHKTHICTKSPTHPLKVEWSIPCHQPTESLKWKLRLSQDKQNLWVIPRASLNLGFFSSPA